MPAKECGLRRETTDIQAWLFQSELPRIAAGAFANAAPPCGDTVEDVNEKRRDLNASPDTGADVISRGSIKLLRRPDLVAPPARLRVAT